jgi:two-component sensor histidine kinase
MNIREACLIYTNLKSRHITILEIMVEHLCFMKKIYKNLSIIIPMKSQEGAVEIITQPDVKAVVIDKSVEKIDEANYNIKSKGSKKYVPFYLNSNNMVGFISYEENYKEKISLDELINYNIEISKDNFPKNYLVPDGIIMFDFDGKIKYTNNIAEYIMQRLNFKCKTYQQFIKLLNITNGNYKSFIFQPVFLSSYLQIDNFDISLIINPLISRNKFLGALVIISDMSFLKKKEKELIEKSSVIKEIHHRVKNNLQTIISLLQMQKRRTNSKLVEKVLNESINRILSIALIHEALSIQELEYINIKKTIYSILEMILSNMVDPRKPISGEIKGDNVYLSAKQASGISLCVTELIQNAVEHAFHSKSDGKISISVEQDGREVNITVKDNGTGIVTSRIEKDDSLGMKIVNTITKHNLKGEFSLKGSSCGTEASIRFLRRSLEEAD